MIALPDAYRHGPALERRQRGGHSGRITNDLRTLREVSGLAACAVRGSGRTFCLLGVMLDGAAERYALECASVGARPRIECRLLRSVFARAACPTAGGSRCVDFASAHRRVPRRSGSFKLSGEIIDRLAEAIPELISGARRS